MRYQVPQFIEIEDKIFGPLTFKQFVYLLGGAGISIAVWFIFPSIIRFLIVAPIILLSLAFAFYKVNNKPFLFIFVSAVQYFSGTKLYVWRKPKPKKIEELAQVPEIQKITATAPKLSEGKLRDVAWSLGVQDSIYSTQDTQRESKKERMMELERKMSEREPGREGREEAVVKPTNTTSEEPPAREQENISD